MKLLEPIFDNNYFSPKLVKSGNLTGSDLWPFIAMGKWLYRNA
jgi:hypothetical protein